MGWGGTAASTSGRPYKCRQDDEGHSPFHQRRQHVHKEVCACKSGNTYTSEFPRSLLPFIMCIAGRVMPLLCHFRVVLEQPCTNDTSPKLSVNGTMCSSELRCAVKLCSTTLVQELTTHSRCLQNFVSKIQSTGHRTLHITPSDLPHTYIGFLGIRVHHP